MERLLTPIVSRLLSRFVKSAAGRDGSNLRASLSGGKVVLHNLELNLTSLFEGLPVTVDRAFAMQLTINIPWTSLGSQPIQVHLDTVEVVLTQREEPYSNFASSEGVMSSGPSSKGHPEQAEPLLSGSWMGSLTNLLLRTLLDVSVSISNAVVKLHARQTAAILMSKRIHIISAAGDWLSDLEEPRKWLKKTLHLASVSLSLEALSMQKPAHDLPVPLLHIDEAEVSALFPVFAVLEGQTKGSYKGAIDAKLAPLTLWATESRIDSLRGIVTRLLASLSVPEGQKTEERTKSQAAASLPEDATSMSMFSQRRGRRMQAEARTASSSLYSGRASSGISSAASGAMNAVGAAWILVSAEAASDGSLALEDAAPLPEPPKLDISVSVSVMSQGASITLYRDETIKQDYEARQASGLTSPRAVPAWLQALRAENSSPQAQPQHALHSIVSPRKSRFLQDFEEAAASLPVSPSSSLPISPAQSLIPPQGGGTDPSQPLGIPSLDSLSRPSLPAPLLALAWDGLSMHAHVAEERLQRLTVSLAGCAIQRAVQAAPADPPSTSEPGLEEILGLHPMASVESPALEQPDGSVLALRMQWQAASEQPDPLEQRVAIHVGQLFAAHVPGLVSELHAFSAQAWSCQDLPQAASSMAGTSDAVHEAVGSSRSQRELHPDSSQEIASSSPNKGASMTQEELPCVQAQGQQSGQGSEWHVAPPAWLTGGIILDASVLSLQLAALSGPAALAQAVILSIERCSVHLGTFKPSARPRSLLAQLLSLQKQPLPARGLRLALSGTQILVAEQWSHAASRAADPEAALEAAGAAAVSEPADIYALVTPVTAKEPSSTSAGVESAADSWALSSVASLLKLEMSGLQLAALAAVVQAVQADLSGWSPQVPAQQGDPHAVPSRAPHAASLTSAALSVQGLWLTGSPAGAAQLEPKMSSCHTAGSQPSTFCGAEVTEASVHSAAASACTSMLVRQPNVAIGRSIRCEICLVEIGIQRQPPSIAEPSSKDKVIAVNADPTGASRKSTPSKAMRTQLPVLYIHSIDICGSSSSAAEGKTGSALAFSLETASFGLSSSQVTLLAAFLKAAIGAPTLPQLTSSPAIQQHAVPAAPMQLSVSCNSVTGQLSTGDIAAEELADSHGAAESIAVCIHDAHATLDRAASKDLRENLALSVGLFELSALCQEKGHNLACFWLVRSFGNPGSKIKEPCGPALAMSITKRLLRGSREELQDITFTIKAIATQICPAALHPLKAILHAASVPSAVQQIPGPSLAQPMPAEPAARRSIRVAIRHASVDVLAALQQEHTLSTSAASSSTPAGSIRASAADLVLMHHSDAHGPQPEGRRRTQQRAAEQIEATALTATATLFGPGMPFRGAPLLLPVDLNLTLMIEEQSLLVSIVAPLLYAQLSCASVETLSRLAHSFTGDIVGMSNLEKPVAAGDTTGDQAALSLTVASQHLRVDLCADAATAPDAVPEERLLQDAAACVELTDLQVSIQSSTHGQSVLVQGLVQASCLDDSTACLEMILEPSPVEILLQRGLSHANSSSCYEQSSQPLQSTRDILDATSDCLLSSLPPPPGLSVLIGAPSGPLRVRLSELRLRSLRRLLAQLRPSASPSSAGSSSPLPSHDESLHDVYTAVCKEHAAGSESQAGKVQQAAAIELQNFCSLDLQFGQLGTAESITLPQGGSMCYRWHTHPGLDSSAKRLLQLRGSSQAASSPSEGHRAASRQAGGACSKHNAREDLHWSEPIDAMSCTASLVAVEVAPGAQAYIAVIVAQAGSTWQLALKKGHRLVNRTGQTLQMLHRCPFGLQACAAGLTADMITIEPEEAHALEVLVFGPGRHVDIIAESCSNSIQVWLGPAAGWSKAVCLYESRQQAGVLEAAGADAQIPHEHAQMARSVLGSLCYQLTAPTQGSGQADILLWPQASLHNGLPVDVAFSLKGDAEMSGVVARHASAVLGLDIRSSLSFKILLTAKGCSEQSSGWSKASTETTEASNHTLPPLRQYSAVDLLFDDNVVHVYLYTEAIQEGAPMLRFVLRPQLVVCNLTQQLCHVHLSPSRRILAQPGKELVYDWQPLLERPEFVSLSIDDTTLLKTQNGDSHAAFQSEPLSTEACAPQLVVLWSENAGVRSFQLVSMQISLEGRDFSAPLQPSTPACETCSISISDGVYLSNLLPSDLYAAHSGESAPAADSLCVLSGQSAPLSWRWQKSTAGGPCIALGLSAQSTAQVAQLLQSGRAKDSAEAWAANASPTWQRAGPAAPAEPETSSARGAGAAPSLASSFADFLEGQVSSRGPPAQPWGSEWQSGASEGIIDLSVHRGRRTLIVLRGSDGQEVLAACRILVAHGRIHIVIFSDPQPPVVVNNSLATDLEVCVECSNKDHADGTVTYTKTERITPVPAGSQRALRQTFSQGWAPSQDLREDASQQSTLQADAEEEEAFLEAVTKQQGPVMGQEPPQLLLKYRTVGAAGWAGQCVLSENTSCSTGGMRVETQRWGASLHVDISSAPDCHADGPGSLQRPGAAIVQDAMSLRLALKCLQVSLWDDERRTILGSPARGIPGSTPHEQEAFCLTLDGLVVSATHTPSQGTTLPRLLGVSVEAEGIQCDSHLPGTSSVLLHSQPASQTAKQASQLQAPLHLQLQVSMAEGASTAQGVSLQESWVNLLSIRVPVLAMAVDDALLACADRLMQHWSTPGGAEHAVTGTASADQDGAASSQGLQALHAALIEAAAVSAGGPRLLLQSLSIAPLHFLADVHLAGGSRHVPISVDTHRAPVRLSGLQGQQLLFRPAVMLQAAAAHLTAEALMNVPRMLGSLELLLNPTGLLTSVSAGLEDLLGLPFAALVEASPAQFVASLGRGPASLLWHVSGWTLTSVSGFSAAASRVIQRNISVRQAISELEAAPKPGMMASLRRRAASAVTLPFDLVSGVTAGIASTTGIDRRVKPRHAARVPGPGDIEVSSEICMHAALAAGAAAGSYIFHCAAAEAVVYENAGGQVSGATALHRPVLLLTRHQLVALTSGGIRLAAALPLRGAKLQSDHLLLQLRLESCPHPQASGQPGTAKLHASVSGSMWLVLMPILRQLVERENGCQS